MHSQTHIHTNNKDFKNIYFTLTEQMLISFTSTDKIMLFENLIDIKCLGFKIKSPRKIINLFSKLLTIISEI